MHDARGGHAPLAQRLRMNLDQLADTHVWRRRRSYLFMSHIFGPIRQLGYVVHDIEDAMRRWSQTYGIGPFFKKSSDARLLLYGGAVSD